MLLLIIYDAEGSILSLCSFAIQLAICIEMKQELNEEFQDCIGSEDHIEAHSEVIQTVLS